MNKENNVPMLRNNSNNENSDIDTKEISSLKTMIKGNVTSQQQSSLKQISNTYKKNDNNEKTKGKENEAKTAHNITRKVFEELSRPTTAILGNKATREFQIGTEQLRSDTLHNEQSPELEHKEHQVNLHHNVNKQLHIVSIQNNKIEELKKQLSVLKQENEAKKDRKTRAIKTKNQLIKNQNVRDETIKSRIEDLKREIEEKEEMKEELLTILKPIEENTRVQALKQKQDLVEELLNTLSFLNYEILELQEKA